VPSPAALAQQRLVSRQVASSWVRWPKKILEDLVLPLIFFPPLLGFNSLVGGIMGFSILLSAEVFKHNSSVWYLDGSIGVLIGLTIFAYGIK